MIKYRGITSDLLTDLSLELGRSVNLKQSELVLIGFFNTVKKDISTDNTIQILTYLPIHLKPFCGIAQKMIQGEDVPTIINQQTILAVFNILEKYIPEHTLVHIYSCFPEKLFSGMISFKKERCLSVVFNILDEPAMRRHDHTLNQTINILG
ncbi:MAG: hypothetical protein H7259_10850 [Cytophagales bacterium]|nr:hypothetical protein [Cytophaga sp.]